MNIVSRVMITVAVIGAVSCAYMVYHVLTTALSNLPF